MEQCAQESTRSCPARRAAGHCTPLWLSDLHAWHCRILGLRRWHSDTVTPLTG